MIIYGVLDLFRLTRFHRIIGGGPIITATEEDIMSTSRFFLFLLLTSGLLVANWQVQAKTLKTNIDKSSLDPSISKQIEVAFLVSLDELAQKMPTDMALYICAPDEVGATQREALQAFMGKRAYFELQEASGGVFAGDMDRLWAKAPQFDDTIESPDEKRIRTKAENFLTQINGLPGDQKTIRRVSFDTMELMDKDGKRRSLPMGVNVTYRRLLEGYEVVGPGGKLKVFHDTKGDVVGYQRVWRKLSLEKENQSLISINQVVERFKENPLGRALLSDVEKVEVKEVRLVYLEHGISDFQKYLQPVYLFSCIAHVKAADRVVQVPYVRYMEALVVPPENLWSSGRKQASDIRPKKLPKPGED